MNINTLMFKEYDIRATYPEEINENVAYIIGKSYGTYLQKYFNYNKCVVGYDNRLSGPSLHQELIKGLLETGINVIDYGMVTTPMHYLTRYKENCPGITITASHNPKDDNGFKFSFDHQTNARGEMIRNFRDFTLKGSFIEGQGILEHRSIKKDYLNFMKKNIDLGNKPLKVVVDPGNGVTTTICKEVFSLFPSIDVTYICDENDGTFPNHHPDPAVESNLTMLKESVIETKADLGIAYDGDGDRVGFIDNKGLYVPADTFMYIISKYLMPFLKNKTILYDLKCSKALEDEIIRLGGIPLCYRTGTSYTEAKVKEDNIEFGGEYSGHIFFQDRDVTIGCGIYAGLRMCEVLSKSNETMNELYQDMNHYYKTPEIKIKTSNELKFDIIDKVLEYVKNKQYNYMNIDGVKVLYPFGWALIRASNTGPDITIRFEAETEEQLNKIQEEFTNLVNNYIA